MRENRVVGTLERHIQSLILLIIATAVIWAASTISEMQQGTAVNTERLLQISKKVDAITSIRARVNDHETRLQLLEKR